MSPEERAELQQVLKQVQELRADLAQLEQWIGKSQVQIAGLSSEIHELRLEVDSKEQVLSGNWVLQNKQDDRTIAVCVTEDSPSCYMTATGRMYLKADWNAVQPCSASLVL